MADSGTTFWQKIWIKWVDLRTLSAISEKGIFD